MLKSVFVSLYLTLLHIGVFLAGYQIYISGIMISNLGLLLSSLPGALFFDVLLFARPTARTKPHLNSILAIKIIGLCLILWAFGSTQSFDLSAIFLSNEFLIGLTCVFGWIAYDFWFSNYGERDDSVIQVGKTLPEFNMKTVDGKEFSTRSLRGHPTLMIFYRGNWCPLCMAQINEIADRYHTLANTGVQILLISPQPQGHTQKLANKYDLPFIYLQDPGGNAAKTLKIMAPNGLPLGMQIFGYDSDTIMPTVIITDTHGKIIFADLTDNYRVRPEPETFIKILSNAND